MADPPRTIRKLLAAALLAAFAAPAFAQGLPDLGDASSATLSESQERTIGNRIMREVRVDPAYVDDPDVAEYVSALGARLLGVSEDLVPEITGHDARIGFDRLNGRAQSPPPIGSAVDV